MYTIDDSTSDNTGYIELHIIPGVSWEYMSTLSNTVDVDPWICIPHLATDDYVTQAAQFWLANLDSERTIYVEYSNEVWNLLFTQTSYSLNMWRSVGLTEVQG